MRYDFTRLKTIHCLNAVTIRVPERWAISEPWQDDAWRCYEEDLPTGCLWIRHQRIDASNADAGDRRVALYFSHCFRTWTDPGDAAYFVDNLTEISDGYVWSRSYDSHDANDGEPLRQFGCMFSQVRGHLCFVTDFKLSIERFALDQSEIQDMIDIMGREILAAKIEPKL